MKKRLLLIYPKNVAIDYNDYKFIEQFTKRKGGVLNAGLGVIAALTPTEFDVKIIDENLENIYSVNIVILQGSLDFRHR